MATVRIYKVAELLNTSSQEVIALLKRDHGIEVKSASSTIEEVVARQFVDRLARQRNIVVPSNASFADTPAGVVKGRKPGGKPEPPKPVAPALPPPRLVKSAKPAAPPPGQEEPAAAFAAAEAVLAPPPLAEPAHTHVEHAAQADAEPVAVEAEPAGAPESVEATAVAQEPTVVTHELDAAPASATEAPEVGPPAPAATEAPPARPAMAPAVIPRLTTPAHARIRMRIVKKSTMGSRTAERTHPA